MNCLHSINSLSLLLYVWQTWHQSMPGNESFTWDHVVIWSSDATAQSFRLHFYDPQLYSGELFLSIQTGAILLHWLKSAFPAF